MNKRLFSWLSFLVVFSFVLQSCVHDEISTASDPASKEYHSKSLWKEDEVYIKNVMKVYFENESNIKKSTGIPYWDYATTVNNFDESFLMVPVVENEKVVSVLKVPRHGDNIYFYYTDSQEDLTFFQGLVFSKYKKALKEYLSSETSKIVCNRQWISVWMPDDQSNPDPDSGSGHWVSSSIIVCKQLMDNCVGIVLPDGQCDTSGGGNEPGYPYPGGAGGSSEPQEDPCTKAKSVYNNTAVKSRYEQLKGMVGNTGETGYGFKTVSDGNGGTTTQTNPLDPDAADPDHMKVGIFATTFGYSHTHLNKSGTDMSVKIFSPADINTFLTILHNAMQNNVPLNTVFGGMVASDPDTNYNIYQIQYTGNGSDLPAEFTKQQLDALKEWYKVEAQRIVDQTGELTHSDLQGLLSATLNKMNIQNTVLFKIEGNTIKKVDYNQNGTPTENPCSS